MPKVGDAPQRSTSPGAPVFTPADLLSFRSDQRRRRAPAVGVYRSRSTETWYVTARLLEQTPVSLTTRCMRDDVCEMLRVDVREAVRVQVREVLRGGRRVTMRDDARVQMRGACESARCPAPRVVVVGAAAIGGCVPSARRGTQPSTAVVRGVGAAHCRSCRLRWGRVRRRR